MGFLVVFDVPCLHPLKAKRELAKKEGRLLTKKQKEERQMAEIRRQALLASGVQIEGLQQPSGSNAPKKVVYGSRKKKPAAQKDASPAPDSRPRSPEPAHTPAADEAPKAEAEQEVKSDWENATDEGEKGLETQVKDSWDASSDEEEKPATPEVKDSWDASSDEEAPAPKTVADGKPAEKGVSFLRFFHRSC